MTDEDRLAQYAICRKRGHSPTKESIGMKDQRCEHCRSGFKMITTLAYEFDTPKGIIPFRSESKHDLHTAVKEAVNLHKYLHRFDSDEVVQ